MMVGGSGGGDGLRNKELLECKAIGALKYSNEVLMRVWIWWENKKQKPKKRSI